MPLSKFSSEKGTNCLFFSIEYACHLFPTSPPLMNIFSLAREIRPPYPLKSSFPYMVVPPRFSSQTVEILLCIRGFFSSCKSPLPGNSVYSIYPNIALFTKAGKKWDYPKIILAKSMQGDRCRKHGNSSFPATVAITRPSRGTNPAIPPPIQDPARPYDEGTEAALQRRDKASGWHEGLVLNKN